MHPIHPSYIRISQHQPSFELSVTWLFKWPHITWYTTNHTTHTTHTTHTHDPCSRFSFSRPSLSASSILLF